MGRLLVQASRMDSDGVGHVVSRGPALGQSCVQNYAIYSILKRHAQEENCLVVKRKENDPSSLDLQPFFLDPFSFSLNILQVGALPLYLLPGQAGHTQISQLPDP